ncbi:MAG: hypothetical protein AB1Z67_03705 [Candidatus Limnocylindrales bacterium]
MNDDEKRARDEAGAAARGGTVALLERVADTIGLHAGASAVFGEPVERDGLTVIPVAQMIIGTGAGGGTSADDESGAGAGGGSVTRPLGYIEMGPAGALFRPIQQPWQNPTLIVSVAFAGLLVAKALRTLLRG